MQGLWDKDCEEVPEFNNDSVADDMDEDDTTSSPVEDDTPTGVGAPSSSSYPLEGKIFKPLPSDDEAEEEEAEAEATEAEAVAENTAPRKRKRMTVSQTAVSKKAKTTNLVQSTLTLMVSPAPVKATPKKSSKTVDLEELMDLSESSDELDEVPCVKG
jgi:hypothetical protein